MKRRNPAFLQLLAAAALFSTAGAGIKLSALSSWQIAAGRSAVAAFALLLLVPAARRSWGRQTLLVGCAYALTMVLFVNANKLTLAANAIFLQATAPLYVAALSPRLLGERPRPRDLALTLWLCLGIGCLLLGGQAPSASAPRPVLGNLLAAASGVSYAATLLGLRSLEKRSPGEGASAAAVVCGNLLAAFACLPLVLPLRGAGSADLLVIAYLGVFQIGLGYVLVSRALAAVSALEASLLLLLEPALSPLWALWLQGERPTPWSWVGGAIVILGTAATAMGGKADRNDDYHFVR